MGGIIHSLVDLVDSRWHGPPNRVALRDRRRCYPIVQPYRHRLPGPAVLPTLAFSAVFAADTVRCFLNPYPTDSLYAVIAFSNACSASRSVVRSVSFCRSWSFLRRKAIIPSFHTKLPQHLGDRTRARDAAERTPHPIGRKPMTALMVNSIGGSDRCR
jgi:hypothetical protein